MTKVLLLFIFSFNVFAFSNCEINFVRYINGELPADLQKNPMINIWDEKFDPEYLMQKLRGMNSSERKQLLGQLKQLVAKDEIYNQNLSFLISKVNQEKLVPFKYLRRQFLDADFDHARFFFSDATRDFTTGLNIDPKKIDLVDKIVRDFGLSSFYQKEYRNILMRSKLSPDDLDFAIESGMKLRGSRQELKQFELYVQYLDNVKPNQLKQGLKHIDDIYVYEVGRNLNPLKKTHQKFLQQTRKLSRFETRRIKEIERGLKLQQKNGLVNEIDKAAQKEANGLKVRIEEKLRFRKKLDDQPLPASLKQRARMQAKHEKNILRRIMNGCNKGSSPRIAGAKKKFSRFKFALALGANPAFYAYKNWDKRESDPFFWEKMGYEVAMGVFFTVVGNKLITNTNTSFWRKYFEGYIKFGALSAVDAFAYETLFGEKSMIRYLQQFYKGDLPQSEIEKEFEKLKNSPDFEKQMKELLAYLEEQSQKHNTRNFLNKYINLSAYASAEDEIRITQEDLQSEDAREMVMELLAERIYLQNMGNIPFFQTGRKDLDRFTFYRTISTGWDIKGLLVNLAIFELMCREPFGTVGSWGAVIAIVLGDRYFDGNTVYSLRREAINQ